MRTRQLIGFLGSALLFLGVFLPIVKLPIVGDLNYVANGRGDGVLVLVLAVVSIGCVLFRWYRELWITAFGAAGVLAFTFFNFQSNIKQATTQLQTDLKDNPFRGLADVAVQSIQLQWGWAVLVIGIVLLVAAAAMKDTSKDFAL